MPGTTFDQLVGTNLRAAREELRWTQADLAARLGEYGLPWTRDTQASVETGRRAVSLQEALVLARTLAVGLPALVAGDPETDVDGHQLVELRAVIDPGVGLEDVRESLKTNIVATRSNEAVDAAARRFGRTAGEIEVAAKRIWGHRFEAEYRRRLAAIPEDARPHTVSALKATALRSMYAEIRKAFEEA